MSISELAPFQIAFTLRVTLGYALVSINTVRGRLYVAILSVLRMDSGSSFQTVGVTEEKLRAAVVVRDLGTVPKSISAYLSSRYGTYGSVCRAGSLIDGAGMLCSRKWRP